jgi:hypothetical protein
MEVRNKEEVQMVAYWVGLGIALFQTLSDLTLLGSLLGSPQQGGGGSNGGLLGKSESS